MRASETLVTGATGFIGQHLVNRLLEMRATVVALVRPKSQVPEYWSGRVTVIRLVDWSGPAIMAALRARPIRAVYHLAAYGVRPEDRDIRTMLDVNIQLLALFVQLAGRWNAPVVAAGSCAEYSPADAQTSLSESAPLEAAKLYGAAKAASGLLASAVALETGVPLRYLRLFNVYGPGEPDHRLLPSLVAGLLRNERVALSDGLQVRDFVFVSDVVDALTAAETQTHKRDEADAAIWNVCCGKGHTVRDFANKVADALGRPRELLGFGELPRRHDDIPWVVGNGQLIAEELGWLPQHSFDIGVAKAARKLAALQRSTAHA